MDRQMVVFTLCGEEYGVAIEKVKEITECHETTIVPNSPDYVEGVINLRGTVTPVIRLKKRFRLEDQDSKEERIIIIQDQERQIGFLVDEASQVLTVPRNQVENTPAMMGDKAGRYISGIAKVNQKMILILDMEKVLSEEEKLEVAEMENEITA